MGYPGQYQPAYPPPAPQYGQPYGQPYYGPPAPPPAPDMNNQLLATLMPILISLPGLTNVDATKAALQARLKAITVPPSINNQPNAADYNTLLEYSTKVGAVLDEELGSDRVLLATLRRQVTSSMLIGMMTGQGGANSNSIVMLILVMALSGGTLF